MNKQFTYNRYGREYQAELIKRADLSTGAIVLCFKNTSPVSPYDPYIVSVKDKEGKIVEWHKFESLKFAVCYFLDMICCYA